MRIKNDKTETAKVGTITAPKFHHGSCLMGITCAMCGSYLLHGFAPYKRHILDWQTTCLDLHPSTFLLLSCVNIIWTMYNFSYFHIELYIVA